MRAEGTFHCICALDLGNLSEDGQVECKRVHANAVRLARKVGKEQVVEHVGDWKACSTICLAMRCEIAKACEHWQRGTEGKTTFRCRVENGL